MNRYIKTALLFTAAMASFNAVAQNTNSAYFTEGYTHRYQLNPAFGNEKNYISIPVVGNINAAMRGTIGLENIFYNVDGQTTTFLNPAVDASVLNDINDMSRLGGDMNFSLMSAGFKAFNGYNTVSINMKGNINSLIPKTLFTFMKEGLENKTYDISNFDVHTDVYGEIALGHSHQLGDKWRIGGAVKFLFGGANVDARFNKAQLTLGEDAWSVVTNAEIQASVKGLNYETEINEATKSEYVSGIIGADEMGLNGFGMAVDLGAEFKPNKNWSISIALLDLGYIKWNNNMVASTGGDKSFTTDKYSFSLDPDDENFVKDEIALMVDDISTLYELEDKGDMGPRTTTLAATLNIGAEFALPVYDKLKFGLLNSTRFQGDYTWTEFRLGANINPVEPLSLAANVAVGTYGWGFGWMANVNVTGFNLFLGMDRTLGKLTKQGLPLSSNGSVNLGVNIPF